MSGTSMPARDPTLVDLSSRRTGQPVAKWSLRQIGSAVALFLVVGVVSMHSLTEGAGLPSPLRKRSSVPSESQDLVSSESSQARPLPQLHGNQLYVDFTKITSNSQLPALLRKNRLYVSEYPNDGEPLSYTFVKQNVDWAQGALRLKVNGHSGRGDVQAAEVGTEAENILYGTVTTRAKATSVEGVCQGFFFWGGDTTEIDIELLSSYYTKGIAKYGLPAGVEFTNRPVKAGTEETTTAAKYPWDPTQSFHDYTITWTKDHTTFSLDGVEVATLKKNVPRKPAAFLWNHWSTGNPEWSAGPPKQDAYLLISHIAGNWTTSKH